MMEKIFLQVINMSYIGSIVIVLILAARLLLAKTPKKYSYILWAVALIRLIVPISFESIMSLIPVNPTPISNNILYDTSPNINTGMPNIDQSISGSLPAADVVVETEDGNSLTVLPNSGFLEIFEHKDWKEKRVNSPLESMATVRIILNEDYYINFYSYEDYAMIYDEDTQEKYRYYTIPNGVYINLQNYVLENGKMIGVKIPAVTDTRETDELTYIGYTSGF